MRVIKRNGRFEEVQFDKITERIRILSKDLSIDPINIARMVCSQIVDNIKTSELDIVSANVCASLSVQEPEYDILGTRLLITNHEKETNLDFVTVVRELQNNKDILDEPSPILDEKYVEFIEQNAEKVSQHFLQCVNEIPLYQMSMFGFKTLCRSYLMKSNRKLVERPEHLFYRVALFLHYPNLDKTRESYHHLAQGNFIHATPTLFHAGTQRPQCSSCFLIGTKDNVEGIYKTITDVAKISKWAGGIGVHISNIRAKNSYIRGTNGQSNGIMPMLRVYNDTSRYIDQCVHGNTKVYTKNGVKPICRLEPGKDEILQKTGYFEVLEKQLEHVYKGDILHFTFANGSTIQITPEHPILGVDECWADAIDLRLGDEILFPIPKYTKDISEYNETLMTCWGLFMGFGNMSLEESFVTIDFPLQIDIKYKELFQYMLSTHMINYQDYLFNDGYQIRFDRNHLSPLRYSLLYNSNGQKQIHSSILHLPLVKLHKFIIGLLITSSYDDEYYYVQVSESTVDDIIYIFARFGIYTKLYKDCIMIQKSLINEDKYNIPGEFLKNTITNITKESYNGVLYDLEFQKEHSYTITSSILHNGGGKRKGSFAMYLEPWHGDIYDFIMAKRNVGNEDERARDLFYGLWIPDLFMKRVEEDGVWSLMCPDRCKGLNECYGNEFDKLYESYELQNKYIRQIKARDLWKEILNSQIETGLPYMLYKDSCNIKSNQKNLGTIRSSNLCCEIIQYSDNKSYSVCNLSSINLSNCLKEKPFINLPITIYTKKWCVYCTLIKKRLEKKGIEFTSIDADDNPDEFETLLKTYPSLGNTVPKICVGDKDPIGFSDFWNTYLKPDFDFEELQKRVQVLVVNMNKVIDKNYYPTEETKRSNLQNRPIGLGVQGLADLFCRLYINFDSEEARYLNRKIFETMYYTALKTSNQYCIDNQLCYSSFKGSPLSQGIFHFELCSNFNKNVLEESPKYDWEGLRKDIMEKGVSNSLFLAPMPTASTSQILNQNECIEPYTSNLYVRRTLAGEFTITNKYLTQDLRDVDLWNKNTIDHLIVSKGSIQRYIKLPKTIRDIYRTAWEIPQKSLIDMAGERQWFIDQSQSFNLFVAEPSLDKLTKMHFYGWKKGLKTGSYYIRTKPQHFSQNFTVDPKEEEECLVCSA
jgi:ribonucleoside-diphosphate reductase alpha subunit